MFLMNCCCLLCVLVCLATLLQLGTLEEVKAQVGGYVRLPCYHNASMPIIFMYIQKTTPEVFINGYHFEKAIVPHLKYVNRTAVDHRTGWMDLWDVSVTDEGEYQCIFMEKTKESKTLTFQLTVTANYSEPVMTVTPEDRDDYGGCLITCSSSGGYPNRSLEWTLQPEVAAAQWMVLNRSSVQDPVTMLYNVSWTMHINSSQSLSVSCSVGGAVTQLQEICNNNRPPESDHPDMTVVVASLVMAILLIIGFIFIIRMHKSSPAADSPVRRDEPGSQELESLT
ncbi:T-lymphocyte activation antigen CD86 [Megalops cyprinoides]|uniref:T-lymphocyte activation antigen CD86 n=1 Tax=Megalops cyprinoides TaxID=118141 RepID=UPI001863EC04|nr:T-lymphocyte activation antigen CD86 [Megalops cyprinoides]